QKMARKSIGKWLTNPSGPTAALVALDPRDGRVLAMFGGNNFRKSQFNLAVQGERQAGSSFKPFVLATALKEGVAPSTTFVSKQVTINAGGRLWEVHNYEDEYLGPITIQQATAYSDNAVFAQLTKLVGLQNVIRYGTGKAAALSGGRPAAGKTGTTENYGDAWFVGYTPQLVTAVWVGYPNQTRPMTYEFHGKPVAGGTFPALIWKSFMERALPYLRDPPESFPPATMPYASPKNVTYRDGRLQLDNGYCRDTG